MHTGNNSHIPRPELDGLDVVAVVQDELIAVFVESGCCEEGGDIRAMAHLSLSIAPDHFQSLALLHELFSLLVSAEDVDTLHEHAVVDGAWHLVHVPQ